MWILPSIDLKLSSILKAICWSFTIIHIPYGLCNFLQFFQYKDNNLQRFPYHWTNICGWPLPLRYLHLSCLPPPATFHNFSLKTQHPRKSRWVGGGGWAGGVTHVMQHSWNNLIDSGTPTGKTNQGEAKENLGLGVTCAPIWTLASGWWVV